MAVFHAYRPAMPVPRWSWVPLTRNIKTWKCTVKTETCSGCACFAWWMNPNRLSRGLKALFARKLKEKVFLPGKEPGLQ